MNEGKWKEAKDVANKMYEEWSVDRNPIPIFKYFAEAVSSEKVSNVIKKFNLSSDFVVQILNPDDSLSENFIAENNLKKT